MCPKDLFGGPFSNKCCLLFGSVYGRTKRGLNIIAVGHAIIDIMTVLWVLASSVVPGLYETMLENISEL